MASYGEVGPNHDGMKVELTSAFSCTRLNVRHPQNINGEVDYPSRSVLDSILPGTPASWSTGFARDVQRPLVSSSLGIPEPREPSIVPCHMTASP
jgi:hypothetical protein